MKNNSILIISNDNQVSEIISTKIKLLRECDNIQSVNYIETISALNLMCPNLIILYKGKTDSIGILKEIRKIKSLNKVPIIFVMDKPDEEALFYAFDNGIDDFFFLNDSDAIILIRIFLTLQKSVLYQQIDANEEILKWENIIDKQNGIYTKDSGARIINKVFAKIKDENDNNSVFLYLKPMSKDNKVVNISQIGKKIKELLRNNDIISYGKGSGFYAVLYNSNEENTPIIIERIKKILKNECIIYANAIEITESFEKTEELLYSKMKKQISEGKEFNFITQIPQKDKNAKIAPKQYDAEKFYKETESITAPVFYQMQAEYNDKLDGSEIKYEIKETESNLILQSKELTSELKIKYIEYPQVIIEIKHIEENKKAKVKKINYNIDEYTNEKLTLIIKEMINEHIQAKSLQKLYRI